MCGIVGYTGKRAAQEIILAGLEKLEYRGYDSAGISLVEDDGLDAVRAVGNLSRLRAAVEARSAGEDEDGGVALATRAADTGVGHTRWATHGRVTEENAHPHFDTQDRVHVVVNGIVENYLELKQELVAEGAVFTSETDAEVIAHLIAKHLDEGDLEQAVRIAYGKLRGHYAFVAVAAEEPDTLVAARKECPLVVGRGDGEQFVASAIPAFLEHTRDVQLIENGEIVVLTPGDVEFSTADGTPVEREIEHVDWSADAAEKGGYETFMLKEIHEQADALAETIADRTVRADGVDLGELGAIDDELLRSVKRIIVIACGTSYHAGLIGRYAIEQWARVPVEMDVASEYRYRDPWWARATSSSASPSPARPRTRSPRCAWPASAAPRSSPSPTSWARRPRATPTACSSPAPGSRSAWPRRRPSSARSRRCTSSRSGSPRSAGRSRRRAGPSSSTASSSCRTASTRCWRTG